MQKIGKMKQVEGGEEWDGGGSLLQLGRGMGKEKR
jgi:hypothetical protein